MTVDLATLKAKLAEYDDSVPRCAKKIARTVNCAPDYLDSKDEAYHDYDLTTYSPCCRPEGHEGECRNSRRILSWPGFETVSALVAEVERLREHRIASTAALLKGYETGKAARPRSVPPWSSGCATRQKWRRARTQRPPSSTRHGSTRWQTRSNAASTAVRRSRDSKEAAPRRQ